MADKEIKVKIIVRRDTSANWISKNPVLFDGEQGWDKTNKRMKIGDGITAWSNLEWADSSIGDYAPLYSDTTTLATLSSGEKISSAFSKIKMAITRLISHIENKNNPHAITASQIGLGDVENKTSTMIRGELTKSNVITALGYTPPTADTNTTYGIVSTTSSGLAPARDGSVSKFLRGDGAWAVPPDTNTDTNTWRGVQDNLVSSSASDSLSANQGRILKNMVDGKELGFSKNTAFNKNFGTTSGTVCSGNDSRLSDARTPLAHTHSKSQIADFPSSMPASDVYSWAKSSSKPSYNYSEIGAAPNAHSHSEIIGTYSGGGGALAPSDIGNSKVRFAMMCNPKGLSMFPTHADCILMDTYYGRDVPYTTGFGILKTTTPRAFLFTGSKNATSWSHGSELITSANISSQSVNYANVAGNANSITGTLAVAKGGTGATTAKNARINIGAANISISSTEPNYQNSGDIWFDTR